MSHNSNASHLQLPTGDIIWNGVDTTWSELIPSSPSLNHIHSVYLLMGGLICMFGLVSMIIKNKLYMSEAVVATIVGIVFGPLVLKVVTPLDWFGQSLPMITLEFTRIVIAIQCMATAVELPGNYLWKEKFSVFMLLGPVMLAMWLIGALGINLILGVPMLDALVISACITPTDPVLANSIVKGKFAEKHIPLNVRLLLSAESGANDGLGTPLLLFAIYMQRVSETSLAIGEWMYNVLLYQIGLAIIIGLLVGFSAKVSLRYAEENEWIDKESILSFAIALAIFTLGLVSRIGGDDILAVFVAGNVLTWDRWFNEAIRVTHFQEVIDGLVNLSYFVYIGALIPWSSYDSMDTLRLVKLVLLAVWVIVLRRAPIVLLLQRWIPALKTRQEAFFAGWFGPVGAGAIFYARLATVYLEYPPTPLLEIIFFIILSSIIVHGGSVPFFDMSLSLAENPAYKAWKNGEKSLMKSSSSLSNKWFDFKSSDIMKEDDINICMYLQDEDDKKDTTTAKIVSLQRPHGCMHHSTISRQNTRSDVKQEKGGMIGKGNVQSAATVIEMQRSLDRAVDEIRNVSISLEYQEDLLRS